MARSRFFLATAAFVLAAGGLSAHGPSELSRAGESALLATSQAAIGNGIGDHSFLDSRRQPFVIASTRGKPLVVSLIYTSCPDVCPMVSETLARAVAAGQAALGRESFRVITIGFDARHDTPERLRAFAKSRGLDLPNWDFLSGDIATIERFAKDVGFVFYPSPKGFDHLTQTTIVDADGRVYRHVYGDSFDVPSIVEPLKDLVLGRQSSLASLEGLLNRVKLICTIYNPATGRYSFDYSLFIAIGLGSVILGGIAFVLGRAWVRHWRASRTA